MIAPVYEKMAEEFPGVVFTKIDVDANSEAAEQCGIQAMPTFQFYKGGQKVGEMKGANEASLRVSFISSELFSEQISGPFFCFLDFNSVNLFQFFV